MEFVYWPAKWELPSIEMDSLYLWAYIKFADVQNITLTPILKAFLQKKGKMLPCLRTAGDELLMTKETIVDHLKLQNFDPDALLGEYAKHNILPMTALIQEKLYPAVVATLWLDDANYNEVIRPAFAKSCRVPLNFTEPKKMRDGLERYVRVFKSMEDEENLVKKLVEEALPIVELFSEFLEDNDYLFGEKPSSLDALLFCCIAPLLKTPSLTSQLQNKIQKTSNLTHYVNRILQKFFKKQEKSNEAEATTTSATTTTTTTESKEEDDQKYEWVFPVCVAAVAMFSYAANAGLLEATK